MFYTGLIILEWTQWGLQSTTRVQRNHPDRAEPIGISHHKGTCAFLGFHPHGGTDHFVLEPPIQGNDLSDVHDETHVPDQNFCEPTAVEPPRNTEDTRTSFR